MYESEARMELPDRRFVEYVYNFRVESVEPKSYRVEVLIGGVSDATTIVDFGQQEALE